MNDVVIRVENLGKLYRIGERQRYKTLRDTITKAFLALLRKFKESLKSKDMAQERSQNFIWALKNVSFEIKKGEVVGVIGRNGVGKSTLLKILSGITPPTEGYAEIHGRIASLLEAGIGFHGELTGRDNVYLNGAILGMKKKEIDRKFDEIVAFAEVEKFIDTPLKHYSSGMHVRLAFAVAAHLEPEILLVDEVLAVGDVAFQRKCLGKMGDIARQGQTVLFVSHNMSAINSLCHKTIYLVDGRVREIGPTEQVITNYLSELLQDKTVGLERLRPALSGMGRNIRFCDIRFVSGDGVNLSFSEAIKFALTLHSDIDLDGLSIGASIFNIQGICIGTLFTKEKFSIKANQAIVLHLTIANLSLVPGSYYPGFGVGYGGREAARSDFDVVVGAPLFQVLPILGKEGGIAGWNPNWGSIVLEDVTLTIEGG